MRTVSRVRKNIVWIFKLLFERQLQSCTERIRLCVSMFGTQLHRQGTKAYRKESSVRGKGSAPGCVPKLLLGNADSAVNGGNQGPSAPVLAMFNFLYSPTLTSIHDYWKNHSLD